MYRTTEEEINKIILKKKIEDEEERLDTLKELERFKSFEDYIKGHKKEFEGIEISEDFRDITIFDEIYPGINLPILKKVGTVAEHFGILIYLESPKMKNF